MRTLAMQVIGWLGCACMVSNSFLSFWEHRQALAIVGLALLTIQAWHLKARNLIILNILSIIGYLCALFAFCEVC
jgi:hypothetical protein